MEKVLVTGGAGFIGSHTCDLLIEKGYDIIILDSLNPKSHNNKWPEYINKKVENIYGNVLDSDLLISILKRVDYVIHLAAEMDLNPDFKNFMDINVGSTALIYELIVKNNLKIKKIIIASTQFVYGEGKWNCSIHGIFDAKSRTSNQLESGIWDILCPICESKAQHIKNIETHQNPPNHYALSKLFQESLALTLGKLYDIPTVALRYSIVHGPRQSLKNAYSGALRTFAINLLLNKELATFEDNRNIRDFVSVFDVAYANYLVLISEKANFEIFNVSGDSEYTINELAKILSNKLNIPYKFSSVVEYRIGDIRNAVSDSSKLKNLGWQPKYSEEFTLELYLKWLKTQEIDFENFKITQKKIREIGIIKKIKNDNK
jgi:dTDP-L-rhamnose 4-epimerase